MNEEKQPRIGTITINCQDQTGAPYKVEISGVGCAYRIENSMVRIWQGADTKIVPLSRVNSIILDL